jgi:hypothetical protein
MTDAKIEMLRHALATLAYRAGKALRDAPPSIVDGRQTWRNSEVGAWEADVARFFAALEALDGRLASGTPLQESPERLFQGPVADALTHVGQIAMLRRMAGCKIPGENYFVARIEVGRVGMSQAAPVREF